MAARPVNPFRLAGRRALLIDSNLLLLYFAGHLIPSLIDGFKALSSAGNQKLGREDFNRLERLIAYFGNRLTTTPHVLAETSNLAKKCRVAETRMLFLSGWERLISAMQEIHQPAKSWLGDKSFPLLGVADTAILHLAKSDVVVVTIDHPLAGSLRSRHLPVIHYPNDLIAGLEQPRFLG